MNLRGWQDLDSRPLYLVPGLALLAWPLVGSGSTWATLTLAGLAMGMIIFIMASGLTWVFGLMDVLNFGHGLFIAVGAFVDHRVTVVAQIIANDLFKIEAGVIGAENDAHGYPARAICSLAAATMFATVKPNFFCNC